MKVFGRIFLTFCGLIIGLMFSQCDGFGIGGFGMFCIGFIGYIMSFYILSGLAKVCTSPITFLTESSFGIWSSQVFGPWLLVGLVWGMLAIGFAGSEKKDVNTSKTTTNISNVKTIENNTIKSEQFVVTDIIEDRGGGYIIKSTPRDLYISGEMNVDKADLILVILKRSKEFATPVNVKAEKDGYISDVEKE